LVKEEEGVLMDDAQVIEKLKYWVKIDRKETNLKKLQGIVWEQAYKTGKIKGHLYDDVLPNLTKWKDSGILLAVYSSGSVPAQKLLFGYSQFGDLTPLFSHYFDTHIGHKRESLSYEKIAKKLNLPPSTILFLSDIEAELEAAQQVGFKIVQLAREGTESTHQYLVAKNFNEVQLTS
jgi:enolase-phosphatase E1